MANKNTNPGGGKLTVPEVMNSQDASRARTHARVVRPTGILKESLIDLPGAHAREGAPMHAHACVHAHESRDFAAWRVKTFGGDFDPVREAVEDAVTAFSDRQASRDRSLWLKVANEIGYEAFRDLYLEQCAIMREYKLRNPSAAFQNRLNRYTGHNSSKRRHGINDAKHSEACEKANAEVVQSEEERKTARMAEEVARMEKAIEGMTPNEVYGYCRKLEDDREYQKRKKPKGAFAASMLSLDQLVDSFEDPSKIQVLSDSGNGKANIRASERAEAVSFELNRLSPTDRRFAKSVLEGKSWQDLGIPESSFYWRLKKIETFFSNLWSAPPKTVA